MTPGRIHTMTDAPLTGCVCPVCRMARSLGVPDHGDWVTDERGVVVAPCQHRDTYVRPAGPWDDNHDHAPVVEPCDLECGNRFFTGHARCRHNRTPDESMQHIR